ncbi:MAG: SLC13 family permease [Gammaproteobacteria bacterium]|nr:SLC13 family permease [Gammaproteobacteria bacterium]
MTFLKIESKKQIAGLILGPVLFALILQMPEATNLSHDALFVAATAALMACWWITEALPISVTAIIPLVLLPWFTQIAVNAILYSYTHHLILLFLGGFLIAAGIQRWNLHKRIALLIMQQLGDSADKIILGFMISCAALSMWVSNTATAMMMLPIGLAMISQLHNHQNFQLAGFPTALMLGIAYACSIGGVATLIGTPPNAILAGIVEKQYGIKLGFVDWMIFAFPLSCIFLALAWYYLTHINFKLGGKKLQFGKDIVTGELKKLGQLTGPEKRVLIVFLFTAFAWLLNGVADIEWLRALKDSGIAIIAGCSLFLLPAGTKNQRLLNWHSAKSIPWEILILFGGGFALASAFSSSGLTLWLANQLTLLKGVNPILIISTLTLLIIFLTEITSNTATASIFLPLMGVFAEAMNISPLSLMIPVAIAASYAFMLPVATPPNAIVFSSHQINITTMAKTGFWLNLIAMVLIVVFVIYYKPLIWA